MDQFGSLDLAWSQGYDGRRLFYVFKGVICYQCGRNVKFLHDDGKETVFAFKGKGIGPFAAHKINKVFAIAERCLKPKIFVYSYPSLEEYAVLEGGAEIEFQTVEFSSSIYLLSISKLPDFDMVLWDYEKKTKLTSIKLPSERLTSVAFNPANWRQICVSSSSTLTVWNIEQANDRFVLLPQKIQLPPEDEDLYADMERERSDTRCSTRASKYTVKVPSAAIAGLIDEMADRLSDIQDTTSRIKPVAQAWTPTGDIFVSGSQGHLIKVDGETYKAKTVFYPAGPDAWSSRLRTTSSMSRRDTDMPDTEDSGEKKLSAGSLNCLALHRSGLFAVGEDGILRVFDVSGEEVRIINSCNMNAPITSLTFSYTYKDVTVGSSMGSIMSMSVWDTSSLRVVADVNHGDYVGIGVLAASANVCVSARSNGMIQAWSIDKGMLLSSLDLQEPACCLACSPLAHYAVVGSVGGQVYFVDFTNVEKPRIVNRTRLYNGCLKTLVFDQEGLYLLVAGDDENVFLLDGKPTASFAPLGFTNMGGDVQTISVVSKSSMVRVVVAIQTSAKCKHTETANQVIRFEITDALIKDLKYSYASARCDLKDAAINKVKFFLVHPSCGIALGEGAVAYTIDHSTHKIHTLTFPADVKKDAGNYLEPDSSFVGHQLQGGSVLLSPHLKWLASYGPDGAVALRTIGSMDRTVTIQPHDYKSGGVRCVCFSDDCQSIFTIGHDGVLCCFKWNLATGGGLGGKARSGLESSRNRRSELIAEMLGPQDDALRDMNTWQHPPPLSRPPSALEKERKERADKMKVEALEKEEIYRTPTPEARANSTWLEEREFEVLREEEKQFADQKKELREQIRDIRRTIQDMMKKNEDLPDIEKLNRHEFDLDFDEQARLREEEAEEIKRVREEIEYDNLAKQYLLEMIRLECWDGMNVKGRSLQAFNSNLEVANFPLKDRTREFMQKLDMVTARRKLEIREMEIRRKEVDFVSRSSQASGTLEDEGGEVEEETFNTEEPSITGSLGANYGGGSELFYSQFDLHLRHQKMYQIVLLEDAIHRIKVQFNKDFDDVFTKKETEITKIRDKNKRITKILADLDLNETIVEPQLSAYEKPEMLLHVDDSEVKVEKYLTPEQRKAKEAREKAEEERRLREKGDNQRERALDMMMGGVLEIRKEDELKKDIPIPAFMKDGKGLTDWTEEEQKMAKEYERKVKELNEEREKFRKQLETELRKLQGLITDGMQSFDETLNNLFLKKIKVMMVIYQEELKILRLRRGLLMEEELETRERELMFKLDHKKKLKQLSSEAVTESRSHMDEFRNQYDILVAEDKVMDKAFKREFHDVSAVMADQLYRLFRKRPRGQKFKGADTPLLDGRNPNPFAERPSTARQNAQAQSTLEAALTELDKPSNMPEGLTDPAIWQRMCQYRRTKIESENMVKQKALVLAEMQAFLQKRHDEDETLKAEIDDITALLNKLKEDEVRFSLNLEVQLLLKQGQVEVDAGHFVHDYRDSVLVHRSVVEELNTTIKQLGESKINSMIESKDFRKGIIQLEWEHKKMSMQMEDLENKMKDIQFMKVTREIQAYLNESDYDAKKAQEISTLEQTILLQKKHHEKNIQRKRNTLLELKHTIKQQQNHNEVLDNDLTELNVAVNERRHIDEVNADRRQDTGAERRYQEIVQRRKLVDLAKAQAQEVAVLRAEVERLRMRTFPALVQVEH